MGYSPIEKLRKIEKNWNFVKNVVVIQAEQILFRSWIFWYEYQVVLSSRGLKQIPFYPDFSNWRITLNREFPIHIIVSNGLFCTNFTYRGLYNPNPWSDKKLQGSSKPTAPSRGRPRSAPARTGAPLHRAHRWNLQNNMNLFCLNGKDI